MSTSGEYVCINCGAALTLAPLPSGELPATAACAFCGVVNERAQLDLIRDRADARHTELVRQGRVRFTLQVLGVATAGTLLVGGIAYTRTSAALAAAWAETDRARDQLKNVHERQLATQARLADSPPSEARDAELQGAANRVSIERKRVDDAAAKYNAEVGTWWTRFVARVKGLPTRAEPATGEGW